MLLKPLSISWILNFLLEISTATSEILDLEQTKVFNFDKIKFNLVDEELGVDDEVVIGKRNNKKNNITRNIK